MIVVHTSRQVSLRFSSSGPVKSRRVLFNVPGSEERKLAKSTCTDCFHCFHCPFINSLPVNQLSADCYVLDFEDGVAISMKDKARELIPQFLSSYEGGAELSVRINSRVTGMQE